MSSITTASATKVFCLVQCNTGAYYSEWLGQRAIDRLAEDGFEIFNRVCAEKTDAPASDIIVEIAFMLAHATYPAPDEAWDTDDEAKAFARGTIETLEIIVESIGQDVSIPPTKAVKKVLDMFTKRAVHRLQADAIDNAKASV
jgi:hypothetical protein